MSDALETTADGWVIEPRAQGLGPRLREVWRYRRMFQFFGARAMQKLYAKTVLGAAWIFLRPLVPLFVRVFLFGALLQVGTGDIPYFLFLAVGNAAWELFASSVMWSTRSLELNQGMLSRVYVPRLILPVATMLPGIVTFLVHAAVIAGALIYYRIADDRWYIVAGPQLLALPLLVVAILAFAVSIGLFTSVLGAGARDVRFGLGYVLEFWVYLTPVVYPLTLVPGQWQWAFIANPMAVFVVAFRNAVFGDPAPGVAAWAAALGLTATVLAAGLMFFQRAEAEAVDSL